MNDHLSTNKTRTDTTTPETIWTCKGILTFQKANNGQGMIGKPLNLARQ
jgi:hypothetical protein